MVSFLDEFDEGEPVVVYDAKGEMVGIPCGFVMFPDGLSWTDDGVAQDYCSHQPYHHLYGKVTSVGGELRCEGLRFSPAPIWDAKFGNPYNSLNRNKWQWQSFRKMTNVRLREARMIMNLERKRT